MKSLGNLGGVVGQGAARGSRAQGLLDFEFFSLGRPRSGPERKNRQKPHSLALKRTRIGDSTVINKKKKEKMYNVCPA